MKIILSRKGFDSKFGGQASPILPDGSLLSFPIPEDGNPHLFSEVTFQNHSLEEIILDLKPRRTLPLATCHLDPDLRKESLKVRKANWKGLFGQSNEAQGHLRNQGVGEGDIFLFFGWFRHTDYVSKNDKKKLKYASPVNELHVLYGYLQIGAIATRPEDVKPWMEYHPHAKPHYFENHQNNTIYVANDSLSFAPELPGFGTFKYSKGLQLTKEGLSRSKWLVPDFFNQLEITHHNAESFKDGYFQSASIGQEFVIEENKEAEKWAQSLIRKHVVI